VLFGVNLELRQGETIALLGTNGAGKSTVLRAISGLVAPKHGTISHEGVDISGMGPHLIARKGLIQVPGGKGVFPSLTVAENLKVAMDAPPRLEYAKTATDDAPTLPGAEESPRRPGRSSRAVSADAGARDGVPRQAEAR
jgi:ABC-type branched-subunit amino acid transport system ATPase component